MPTDIASYVDWLVEQKSDLKDVDPEVLTQLKKDLTQRLEDQINAMILASLPTEQLPNFEQLLDTGTSEQVQEFCNLQIPDLAERIAAILTKFKLSFLGV